jgi:hypothetical protein
VGVAVLVWQLDRRYKFGRGRAFALYVMAYTVGRFWVEYLRVDNANHFLGMRLNNWTAIVVFLGALAYFLRVRGPQERLEVSETGEIRVIRGDEAAPEQEPAEATEEAAAEEETETATGDGEPPGEAPEDDGAKSSSSAADR